MPNQGSKTSERQLNRRFGRTVSGVAVVSGPHRGRDANLRPADPNGGAFSGWARGPPGPGRAARSNPSRRVAGRGTEIQPIERSNEVKPKKSYAEYLKDWRHLLSQFAADPALAEATATQRQTSLAALIANIDELLRQQSDRDAAKQAASNQIRILFDQGRELVRDIKLELRGSLGARSLELVKFRMNPLRETRRSKKAAPEGAPQGAVDGGKTSGVTTPAAGTPVNGALNLDPA